MPAVRVLMLSTDPVTTRMPGPAIRAWHLAEVLARWCRVTLVSTVACDRRHPQFATRHASFEELPALGKETDVVVSPAGVLHVWPELADLDVPAVFDLYDPYHLENLASGAGADVMTAMTEGINAHLRRGDWFLCASERQRDFWTGALAALGRVNPLTYRASPDLAGLVDVVPFGISRVPPRPGEGVLRRRFAGISPTDRVLLWAGGIYDWFDPLTLIEAVGRVRRRRHDVRLVFMGAGHPNPAIPPMPVVTEAQQLVGRLGLDKTVLFNDQWVGYDDRDRWLTDADVGVSTHRDHAETRYSFRTRVLDYLWAGLPTVLSAGDVLSDAIAGAGAGYGVAPGDPDALADGLEAALDLRPGPQAFEALRRDLYWDRVAVPLVRFCQDPKRAADASRPPAGPPPAPPPPTPPPRPRRWRPGRRG